MISHDTIVAISSALGNPALPAAQIIVRLSGDEARAVASRICQGIALGAGAACATSLRLASLPGLAVPIDLYVFCAPHSYTGQDVIEFHLPGSALLARLLLEELTELGCRLAEPGEFTARAYFSGRLDLTEAEGVAATIAAANDAELRAARQLLSGELSRRLRPVMDRLAETLALLEVGIDFSEEDVTFLKVEETSARLSRAITSIERIIDESARFDRLTHEPRAVLVGRPNAGKSTLLNALAGRPRAIVSPIAGTTRDALSAEVALPRGLLRLVDLAGLHAEAPPPFSHAHSAGGAPAGPPIRPARQQEKEQEIPRQMRQQAIREMRSADLVISVCDATSPDPPLDLPPLLGRLADLILYTKADLLPPYARTPDPPALLVSAVTGAGLEALRWQLDSLGFGQTAGAGTSLAINARHLSALGDSLDALHRAAALASNGKAEPELLALEIREALDVLGGILGAVSTEELLGRIFSAFCIGK